VLHDLGVFRGGYRVSVGRNLFAQHYRMFSNWPRREQLRDGGHNAPRRRDNEVEDELNQRSSRVCRYKETGLRFQMRREGGKGICKLAARVLYAVTSEVADCAMDLANNTLMGKRVWRRNTDE